MHRVRDLTCLTLAALVSAGVLRVAAEQEIHVGCSAAGQLKAKLEFTQPVEVEPSIFPGISGFATAGLALHSAGLDEPTNDFFQLSTAVDLRFILLAKDAGMEVWNDNGTGFMATNGSFFIGQSPFDTHPVWNTVNGTPGHEYALTLKLRDLNGIYSESAPFVLRFTPRPWPGPFRLQISRLDSANATLSWPTQALGWELQSAASAAAVNWDAITDSPAITGTNFSLHIDLEGTQQFFRLQKP